jgi:hypothetical protein
MSRLFEKKNIRGIPRLHSEWKTLPPSFKNLKLEIKNYEIMKVFRGSLKAINRESKK